MHTETERSPHLSLPDEPNLQSSRQLNMPGTCVSSPKTNPHADCVQLNIAGVSLVAQLVKNLPAVQETLVQSWVGKVPCRRNRLPTPVFLPGHEECPYAVDRRVWRATAYGVTKSQTRLSG